MKLIVDIDEDVYTRLFDNGIQDNEIAVDDICEMARALRMGTPLDDVRAEIVKDYEDATMYSCDEELSRFASRVCGILGNVGKAESEDKE